MEACVQIGPFSLTPFGLCVAAGAAAWYLSALAVRRAKYRRGVKRGAVSLAAAWMLALGLVLSRTVYCAVNANGLSSGGAGFLSALRVWEGGGALCGALCGALIGLAVGARRSGARVGRLANCFGPGLLLFAAVVCAARRFAGEGWGKATEAAFLQNTPLVVSDIYGESRYAVYRMEAVAYALSFLIALSAALRRGRRAPWECLSLAGALYALFALVFASMREGGAPRVEFVKIEQAFALLLLLGAAAPGLPGRLRAGGWKRALAALLLIACGTALVTAMEFAVDREGALEAKYACMLLGAALAASGALLCLPQRPPREQARRRLRAGR